MKALLLLFILCISSFAMARPAVEFVPGEFIVKMKDSRMKYTKSFLTRQLGVSIDSVVNQSENLIKVSAPAVEKQEAALERLKTNPMVAYAEPNFIYHADKLPNDADFKSLWGMKNIGQADPKGQIGTAGFDVNADKAWDIATGSKQVVVAVIDTGVNFNHPDLKDNVWKNEKEIPGNAIDDDKNGFVDDVYGWNFSEDKADGLDDHGHGSHVSGTIGGAGNNGQGVAGVNWSVRIMPVKFLSATGSGTLEAAVKAIDYATANGAKIMSNSWGGGGFSQALEDAIKRANDKGILFVAAAGNDGQSNDTGDHYPSSYKIPNVLAVAAIDNQGQLASFSNFGKNSVHVGAPGVNIWSSVLNNGYASYSGTSMATPHVSGVAALVLSHEPTLTGLQLKERIVSTAKKIQGLRGKTISGGLVDAYAALMNQPAALDPEDPSNWTMQPASAESAHPYVAMSKFTTKVSAPGAKKFAIHFSKIDTEMGYDNISITDSSGIGAQTISGLHEDFFSDVIDGDTAQIAFSSDNGIQGWGFQVDGVAVK